ncbi:hypothetical protein Tco_0327109 [Tanacetum coccineum]
MDDLYNNLKVYEPEVKGMSSSSSSTQNMAFVFSSNNNTSSSNKAVNVAHGVTIASTQVNTTYSTNIDNLSDDSDQAEEGPNYTLMAYSSSSSDSGVSNDSNFTPPYTRNFMPPTPDLPFTGLDEFVNEPIVENCKAMSSEEEPKGNPQMDLQDQGVIDSGCSRHMTGNMSYLTKYEEIDSGYFLVPPPYKGNFMPPTPDLSFTGLDEFVNEPVVENCKAMSSEEEPMVVRKYDDAPSIEEWVSNNE